MSIANQHLTEIIDFADISVRIASQLRLFGAGRELRDLNAIERGIDFLAAAIEGGEFLSTETSGLTSTLRPLNWAADIRLKSQPASSSDPEAYGQLVKFLSSLRVALAAIRDGQQVEKVTTAEAIAFFGSLGELLGTRADQYMRKASSTYSNSTITLP